MATVTSALSGRTHVVLNGPAMQAELRGPNGMVFRRLIVDGEKVKVEAQRRVGKRTRYLHDHILKRTTQVEGAPAVIVGVFDKKAAEYAKSHHDGAGPHKIVARRAPKLVFFWPKVGHVVSFREVNHPGNRANPFLTDAIAVIRGKP